MRQDDPERSVHDDLIATERLFHEADSGILDSIECPRCHQRSVSVWFTRPKENQYRTWLVCGDCSFEARAINSERPRSFSEKRIHERLQAYDSDLLGKARFPWPPA
jgi:hypothetical protein